MEQLSLFTRPPFIDCAKPETVDARKHPPEVDGRHLYFWCATSDDGELETYSSHPNRFTPEWCNTHRKAFDVRCNQCEQGSLL